MRIIQAWVVNALLVAFVGVVPMFVAFFVAYAFVDEVGLDHHVVFLILVAGLVLAWTPVLGLIDASMLRWPFRAAVALGFCMSACLHLVAVALGTGVAMAYEDQGSVTADQPDGPFLALIAVCALLALVAAWASTRLAAARTSLAG